MVDGVRRWIASGGGNVQQSPSVTVGVHHQGAVAPLHGRRLLTCTTIKLAVVTLTIFFKWAGHAMRDTTRTTATRSRCVRFCPPLANGSSSRSAKSIDCRQNAQLFLAEIKEKQTDRLWTAHDAIYWMSWAPGNWQDNNKTFEATLQRQVLTCLWGCKLWRTAAGSELVDTCNFLQFHQELNMFFLSFRICAPSVLSHTWIADVGRFDQKRTYSDVSFGKVFAFLGPIANSKLNHLTKEWINYQENCRKI